MNRTLHHQDKRGNSASLLRVMRARCSPGTVLHSPAMFCPECKSEYRPGFTRCVDCDVALVEKLPEADSAAGNEPAEPQLQRVWNGADPGECAYVCGLLKESGIPYKMFPQMEQFWKPAEDAYWIGVPSELADRAKQMIGATVLGDADDQTLESMELPADEKEVREADDDWDPDKWDPETATTRLWSGQDADQAEMIESSLRENHIHSRTDALEDGSRNVFVAPADEVRAKEIVREIETGSPEA